jgi:aminoglycoside phosphotransferase (APT) family kinase protein
MRAVTVMGVPPNAGRGRLHVAIACGGTMRTMALTWLTGRSVPFLREALRQHAPELASEDVELRPWIEQSDPMWRYGSAIVGRQYFVKFAWSRSAAEKVWHEACVLDALGAYSAPLHMPRVVVASDNPALLATEWIAGEPLTIEQVGQMDSKVLEMTASELARYLADLHSRSVLAAVLRVTGSLATPLPQATTSAIRANLTPWIRSDQVSQVGRWCEWADEVLGVLVQPVFVQGDFHGHNQLWDRETQTLRAVLDYGESGAADPAYDFRYLPAQGPKTNLFLATATQYGEYTGKPLNLTRVMAWHMRTVLGDALWRSRAGVPLPDDRTPAEWVDDLRRRLNELDLTDV